MPISSSTTFNREEFEEETLFSWRAEVVLNYTAAEVWEVLANFEPKISLSRHPELTRFEHISGEINQEGQLVLVDDGKSSPFYQKSVIRHVDHQRVVYFEAVDGSVSGFVDHSLYEHNETTKLVYSGYTKSQSQDNTAGASEEDIKEKINDILKAFEKTMNTVYREGE